jgi:hypothetical protein
MNFVFENIEELMNLTDCADVNPSGIRRFTTSPVVSTMIRYMITKDPYSNNSIKNIQIGDDPSSFDKYIIATGVTHSPWDWCRPSITSLFSFLNATYLKDLQLGKSFLLLDQSHEGYHEDWMFDSLHIDCDKYRINPKQIIYVTGNLQESIQYDNWIKGKNPPGKMLMLPYAQFEHAVATTFLNRTRIDNLPPLPTVSKQIAYKGRYLDKIKLYNALQKRPRAHRAWLFRYLWKNNLLNDGINSMNRVEHANTYYMDKFMDKDEYDQFISLLPMLPPSNESDVKELQDFSHDDSGKYQMRFNEDIALDTWVTVISEAAFGENNCFISEKTFKFLAYGHPFIIAGNRYSLQKLKELGYKTFSPFIDETYDELDTWDRYDAIIHSLIKIKNIPLKKKLDWFIGMKEIMEYNSNHLLKNSFYSVSNLATLIENHYRGINSVS